MNRIVLSFIFLLIATNLWSQQSFETKALECYNNAQRSTDIQTKLDNLEAAVDFKPDFIEARFELGKIYLSQKRYKEAKIQFNKMLDFEPNNVQAYNELGNVYFEEENYSDALSSYQFALKLNKGFKAASNNIKKVEVRQKVINNYNQAQAAYDREEWKIAKEFFEAAYNLESQFGDVKQKLDFVNSKLDEMSKNLNVEDNYDKGAEALLKAYQNNSKNTFQQALAYFLEVNKVNPNYKDTRSKISKIREEIAKLGNIEDDYQNGLDALRKAQSNPDKNNYQQALNYFLDVSRVDQNYKDTRQKISEINNTLKKCVYVTPPKTTPEQENTLGLED